MSIKWRNKDERQFKHIKNSLINDDKTSEQANEIAARIVNKQRRKEGVTNNITTLGTGNPYTSLEERSKRELYNRAKQLNIDGRSKLNKKELIAAIRQNQG